MLIDILKDPRFNTAFSFLMGVFIILLIRPSCKGESCFQYKSPPMDKIKDKAYKIGDTCYKFIPNEVKCPMTGVIEPFQWTAPSNALASGE
jgi:hypothetical protein